MILSEKSIAVLDACVLYNAPIRDILLSFSAEGLFTVKWSDMIQQEWLRNLLKNRPDLNKEQLNQTVFSMNAAFPYANVESFQDLIASIQLPDKDDRHVVACAIKSNAQLIVTFNVKDFPQELLDSYHLKVQTPDELISNILDINSTIACSAFDKMVKRLKNPEKSKQEVLTALEKCGLTSSIIKLKSNCC